MFEDIRKRTAARVYKIITEKNLKEIAEATKNT